MNKQQLASTIWQSANQMRSKIEANEYKDYILGFMFYKYLSDREISFLKGEKYSDEDIKKVTADDEKLVKHISENIGYFIAYEDLFSSWLSKGDDFDVSDVRDALSNFDANIEPTYKKLFENIFKTLQSGLSKLGETSTKQTKSIKALLKLIKRIPMDGKQDYDVLGFIYEYLISMFAANAGKKAGEFYTPHEVSVLMSEIVANHLKDREHIKIYDPTSGSGSLLINIGASMAQYIEGENKIDYYAQELKENTYNLTRMNLVMRGINPANINVRNGDTLEDDWPFFETDENKDETYSLVKVDAVVSNPPYSQKWDPKNKEFDPRFKEFGVAPKAKADSKFVNTLYLDKMMEYENLIQAFSRTNRLYNMAEKPFGIIKYYRRPNTMEKNIEAAVKAYSGDVPTGLFVDKLPNNLRNMNVLFQSIEQIFKNAGIVNFEKLPADNAAIGKFAKEFNKFVNHLEAAIIQGFTWNKNSYPDEDQNEDAIKMLIDEQTYLTLLARYKEITRGGGGGAGGDVPYEIDVHITEYDTGKIDANYMNSNFDKYVKLIQGDSDPGVVDAALKELHRSFSMLSQEEQRYAERFIHAVESGQAKLVPGKTFRDYITDYMKADEHARINRVVRRLGCYYALLKELLDRHATPSNIDDRGTFTELKKSVNKTKAENFFRLVFKDDYVPLRLPIYSENYLRDFIFSGGKDPYLNVIEVEQTSAYTPDDAREYNKPKVVVVKLTDNDYVGREIRTSVSYKTLENWYSESNAVKSVIESECFAYVEDKLCVATSECLERTDDGKIRLTEYAKTHEEECFLQFIVDEKDGTLHYVKLPKSKADEAFNYNDAITEDLLSQYGLVNEMSKEMLNAIDGEEFGSALDILMDKHICNYSARLLRSITGLDNRTISNMKKGENLTKSNVISACLGIHIPFRVSNHMLSLADLTLNMTSKGQVGDDNETYDMLLHLKWTTDYDDIYEELKVQSKDHLIHQPPVKK